MFFHYDHIFGNFLNTVVAKTTASPSYVPSYPETSTPKQPQIDLDGLKREIAEFAKLAAEQSASQVETKVKFSQDEMQEEVDRVVELVKGTKRSRIL